MRPRFSLLALSILFAAAWNVRAGASDGLAPFDPNDGWKIAAKVRDVIIYSRSHPGSHLKEFGAVGAIEAPTRAVHAVIDDFENYPNFMPFTIESRLVRHEADSVIGYQRLSPKICADRDYTLRVWNKSWAANDGRIFRSQWTSANEFGPPEKKGVVRVKICNGGWLLEPDGAIRTRATYSVFTDTGGLIPPFLANYASQNGISRLFEAVRKQVKDPKYALAD
jgi:hypothetical protein